MKKTSIVRIGLSRTLWFLVFCVIWIAAVGHPDESLNGRPRRRRVEYAARGSVAAGAASYPRGAATVAAGPAAGQSVDKLLRRLGTDFDAALMSVDRPNELEHTTSVGQSPATVQQNINLKMYDELLRRVNFTVRDETTGNVHPMKPSVRKYLERWLLQRASCPIRLVWNDLGALFWPRWVRRGICGDGGSDDPNASPPESTAESCSWPPGMRCVPEASQTVRLLRWHCSRRQTTGGNARTGPGWNRETRRSANGETSRTAPAARKSLADRDSRSFSAAAERRDSSTLQNGSGIAGIRCRWKKVPYSVTTGCFCSC